MREDSLRELLRSIGSKVIIVNPKDSGEKVAARIKRVGDDYLVVYWRKEKTHSNCEQIYPLSAIKSILLIDNIC